MDATVRSRTLIADRTWELDLDLHANHVEFAAGQYCRVELPQTKAVGKKNSGLLPFPWAPDHAARPGRSGQRPPRVSMAMAIRDSGEWNP